MLKPSDFDTAKSFSEREPLPPGGYVCRIVQVQETTSQKGADMVKISLDIAEGPEKNRFSEQFKNDTRAEKKWPCIVYQLVYDSKNPGATNPGFKSFTTSVTESNNGFNIQWGDKFCDCFKNKLIGVLFQREQYMGTDGVLHWSTKPTFFRSADSIRQKKFTIPADKPYSGAQGNGAVVPPPSNGAVAPPTSLEGYEEIIPDGDLPF